MIKKNILKTFFVFLFLINSAFVFSNELVVNISNEISFIDVKHKGKKIRIQRNQSTDNVVNSEYAKPSRKCPPFCIQPSSLGNGVETIGELELLEYLKKSSDDDSSVLVIDSRTQDWVKKGTIPGSINIPWDSLKPEAGADPFQIADILEKKFNVTNIEGLWNLTNAKPLVLF